jgi:hypothetical protein
MMVTGRSRGQSLLWDRLGRANRGAARAAAVIETSERRVSSKIDSSALQNRGSFFEEAAIVH